MNELIVTRFLDALVSNKLVDRAPYKEGRGALVLSDKMIPFSVKEKGFAIGGENPFECYCPNPEASLVRVLSCRLFGTTDVKFKDSIYNSVSVYPKAIRSDGILFSTANGKEFLASSSNTRVTLGLYDILYSRNADSSILMMPELLPSGSEVVSIANSKVRDYFVSPKTELLSSSLTFVSDEVVVPAADAKKYALMNQIYSDKSKIGDRAPTNDDLITSSQSSILRSTEKGYIFSSDIFLDSGISYHLEEDVKPNFALVQSSVTAANAVLSDLKSGVIFSSKHTEAVCNIRQNPKVISESSSFSCTSEISSQKQVSEFWNVPVYSEKVKSVVWSY